ILIAGVVNLKIPVYQVDAFTSLVCKGNPAAVCLVDRWPEDRAMQDIAAELNLSETTFLCPQENEGSEEAGKYSIRWFAPRTEVSLCGHATLAASKVIFDCLGFKGEKIIFDSAGGTLESRRHVKGFTLDFPKDEPVESGPAADILEAMGIGKYRDIFYGRNTGKLVVRLQSAAEVRSLRPDFERLKSVKVCFPVKGVGVTAEGDGEYDIVSRYFNPWAGVNEDPVTGSVHTVLAPYWSQILGRKELKAWQASERGGELLIRVLEGDRLEFIGDAVVVLKGEIFF
ncbi:MAG TPA: PhzF family phenazine biosynthesis protein, partial [Negativicutes bacterium]|nr:PhzF family phenazine biosynthesis protein [Negativicutes bacterium]